MRPYRAEAIGGTTLLGGGVIDLISANIPTQYQQAVQADPDVKTVIMTAGGNDILQTGLQEDCEMQGEACAAQVTKVLDTLSMLWAKMAADGVQDIVYILYATPAGKSVDFLLPSGDGALKRCGAVPAPARCHIVETLAIVMGDIPDGIHPSQTASDRIGKAVVDLMAARGMRR
jgi:lysophospholipase L1-like esterase